MALKSVMINGLFWMDRLRMGLSFASLFLDFTLPQKNLLVIVLIQFY